jgi:transaldolase
VRNPSLENISSGLRALGQSAWLDDPRRRHMQGGTLVRLIHDDGVSGISTNPAVFQRAIREPAFYDKHIDVYARKGDDAEHIHERRLVDDAQHAADLLRPRHVEAIMVEEKIVIRRTDTAFGQAHASAAMAVETARRILAESPESRVYQLDELDDLADFAPTPIANGVEVDGN